MFCESKEYKVNSNLPVWVDIDFVDIINDNGRYGHDLPRPCGHQRHGYHRQEEVRSRGPHHVVHYEGHYISYNKKNKIYYPILSKIEKVPRDIRRA